MNTAIDISQPIVPATSIAGIVVGHHIVSYADITRTAMIRNEEPARGFFERWFYIAGGAVILSMDIRSKRVFKLAACEGYRGTLFGTIHVGDSPVTLLQPSYGFQLCPGNGTLISSRIDGIGIDVGLDDPEESDLQTATVTSISIWDRSTIF